MSQNIPTPLHPAETQALALAASIEAAAADLECNGPATPDEVRQALLGLEAEWEKAGDLSAPEHRTAARSAR